MTARVYAHPTLTLDDIRRIWQQHGLVAVSLPVPAHRRLVVELVRMAPRPWAAPGRQVLR